MKPIRWHKSKTNNTVIKMTESTFCTLQPIDSILLITINRPQLRNALHPPASRELADIFKDFQNNKNYRVAIITGSGGEAFCAGNDVKFSANATLEEMALPREGFGGLTAFFDRTKPVIAAVNGMAFGGGFEIALSADLIIASQSATFALPEPKIGLAALGGGIHRLSRQIPYKKAVEILLTGKKVTAVEGERLGFVNSVVSPNQLIDKSIEMARQIINCSPVAIDVTMTALYQGQQCQTLLDTMKSDYRLAKRIYNSKDFKEGLKAFAEKRKPQWPGE